MTRRALLLPVLALVGCQTDAPTDTGTILAARGQPEDARLQMILADWVVDEPDEFLEFVVINPTVTQSDCQAAGSSGSLYVSLVNTTDPYIGDQEHPDFCTDGTHWVSVTTGDDTPDLAVHFKGDDVCDELARADGSHVRLDVLLDGGTTRFFASETFRIRCPSPDG